MVSMLNRHRFGGTNGTQWFNDVWCYDPRTNTWTQQECIGYIPAPREGHSAALVGDVMYIFGGRTEEGTDLGDLAAFRIPSKRWYTFQNMGPSPSPRSGHSMTAHGKQLIVLAGEPSSAPRDPGELSMVYVLDTAKIRYPSDQAPSSLPKSDNQTQALPNHTLPNQALPNQALRRPSGDNRGPTPTGRSSSSQGQVSAESPKRSFSASRESTIPPPSQLNRGPDQPAPGNGGSRLPRTSVAQAPSGPPPTGQPPNPKTMGPITSSNGPRSRTPTKDRPQETIRSISTESEGPNVTRETPQEPAPKPVREPSPGSQGRRTPTQSTKIAAKAMEAGEAAPLVSGGPTRQRSLRSQRGQNSIDGIEDVVLGRSHSGRGHSDSSGEHRSSRILIDGPRSPKITPHQEALMRELDAAKSQNAWYASELALAKKAGYQNSSSDSPTFQNKIADQVGDDDRPLVEAFLNMRAELARMQQTIDQQASSAAKKMAEIEHQRDAAVTEAAYARAKLAAHGGSQRSTPQPDSSKDIEDPERSTDMSRRLALALAAQSEHRSKLESMVNEIQSERRAREIAEETAGAAQKRLDAINESQNPLELAGLRSELVQLQKVAREEASERSQAEEGLRLLRLDKDDLDRRHDVLMTRLGDYGGSMGALEAAVAASADKTALLERRLDQERTQRDGIEQKLRQLRGEHEERTSELENALRRLRDAEELAETHAKEASTHRDAFVAGLAKAANFNPQSSAKDFSEERINVLQQSTDRAHALVRSHQEAADHASEKLRAAEERIAGLEAYQEQTSREGLHIRRQLQTALKEVQSHQTENKELKSMLETHQRDASALAVQHGALKDLLGERGVNISDVRRSPLLENSNTPRLGTPDQSRLRELDQQLQNSNRANEELKASYEASAQEAHRQYSEKLEQLENDYQSTIHYVKGTEKILKRMKDELSKYKTHNSRLQTELDAVQKGTSTGQAPPSPPGWDNERQSLQRAIEDIRAQSSAQIASLESSMASVHSDLASARLERDAHKGNHEEAMKSVHKTQSELDQLRAENAMLEAKAQDAENRVTMLLDQVGQSVGNFRRQSQIATSQHVGVNGSSHTRNQSQSTAGSSQGGTEDAMYNENRGSLALDSLASELDALRSHWESTNRSYRLSNQFDFERTPTKETAGSDLTDSLASWRKRLDDEEHSSKAGAAPVAVPKEDGMI